MRQELAAEHDRRQPYRADFGFERSSCTALLLKTCVASSSPATGFHMQPFADGKAILAESQHSMGPIAKREVSGGLWCRWFTFLWRNVDHNASQQGRASSVTRSSRRKSCSSLRSSNGRMLRLEQQC